MLKEFRDFIAKGNMVEIAIGLLIAAAFTGVVTAFTKDLINPLIGLFSKVDFSQMGIILKDGNPAGPYTSLIEADKDGAVILRYGDFVSVVINFFITAAVIFLVLKSYNKMLKKTPPPPDAPALTTDQVLLTEIRDLLQTR